uniref:Uncharacterized protein n=1 Tax=virus sp. ctkyY8 TaxID=2827995 RepID=A0A8S5RF24_9VIRU|nr:MAG TPA: hypothetical protein [virus sp. ctkyY8]
MHHWLSGYCWHIIFYNVLGYSIICFYFYNIYIEFIEIV